MSSNNQTISPDLIRDETLSHPPHEEPIQSFLNQFRRNSEQNSTNGSGAVPSKTLPPQSNNLLSLFSMASLAGPNTNQHTSSNPQTQPSLPKAAPGFNADKDASQNLLSLLTKNVISPSFPSQSPNLGPTIDSPKLQHQDGQNGISRSSIKSPEKLLEESSQALRNLIVGQAPKSENDLNHYYTPTSTSAANGIQDSPFAAFVKGFAKEKKQDSDNSFSASELASVSPQNVPLPATPQSEKSSRAISPKTFFSSALSPSQQEKTTSITSISNIDSKDKDIGTPLFDNSNLFDLLENSVETSLPKAIPVSSSQRNIEISDKVGLESIPSAIDYLDNFTISQVTSEAELNSGQLVSSHCGLISYVMKSGKVRLIYEKDGYRTLLRDDKSQIIDMKLRKHYSQEDFENGQNHRLVTLSQSNNFIIWDIKRNSASDRGLEYSMVCKINGNSDDIEFSRAIFHPTNPNIIAVSCSSNEILIFNTEIIPTCANPIFNLSELDNVTTVLSGLDDALTSICFSPDGSCVFAGTQSGVVGVWNWSNSPHPLMKIQTNTHLPIHYIQPCQPKSSKNQTTLLPASFVILGFNHNLQVQLWDMTSQQSIHTIQFKLSTPITKKSVNTLKFDPVSETLFVGCSSRSSIILFNLSWVYDNLPLSKFTNSVEYSCPEYILSMDISSNANPMDSCSIVLYLMHAKTIQMYTIPAEQLLPGFDRSTLQPRATSPPVANTNSKSKQIIIAQPDKPAQQILKDNAKTKTAQKAKKNFEPKANNTQPSLSLLSMGDFKPIDTTSDKSKTQAKEHQSKSIISMDKIEKSKASSSPAVDSQKLDHLSKTLTKSIDGINQNINYTLSTVVPATIQRGVSESINLSLEQQVPALMDQYFTGPDFQKYLDSMIQHHVSQALQSDSLVESITGAITSNVIAGIQDAFQSSFTTLLIPAYQKATQTMFTQMQSAFESGLNKNFEELQKLPSLYPGASMLSPSHVDPRQPPFPIPHHLPPPPPHAIPPHYPLPQHPQHPQQMIPQSIPQNPTQGIPKEEDNAITRFLKMNNSGAPSQNAFPGPAQPLPFPSANVKQPSPPITQPATPPTQQNTTLDPSIKDDIIQAVSVKDVPSLLKLVGNQNVPLVFYTCQFKQRDILGLAKILARDLNQQTGIRLQVLQEAIRNIDCKDTSIVSHLDHFLEFIYNQCNAFEKGNPQAAAQWSQLPLIKNLILDIKKQ